MSVALAGGEAGGRSGVRCSWAMGDERDLGAMFLGCRGRSTALR